MLNKINYFDTINKKFEQISSLIEMREFERALKLVNSILNTCKKRKNTKIYIRAINFLAGINMEMERYSDAKLLIVKQAQLYKKVYGEYSQEYGIGLFNLAMFFYKTGQFSNAQEYVNKTFYLREQNRLETIESMNLLALIKKSTGKYKESEEIFINIKSIYEDGIGEKNLNYVSNLNSLGAIYIDLEEYKKGEDVLTEAINIYNKIDLDDDILYANCLDTLGNILKNMGKYSKAEELYLKAKDIYISSAMQNSLGYANCLDGLGGFYKELNNYDKAVSLYLNALEIREKILGDKHSVTANSYNNLGIIYLLNDQIYFGASQAKEYLQKSLKIREERLGNKHAEYGVSLINLANFQIMSENYKEAEDLLIQAKEIYNKKNGQGNYAICLQNLALVKGYLGDIEEASNMQEKACNIFKNIYSENHYNYSNSLFMLAHLYICNCKTEEAYEIMYKAINIENEIIINVLPYLIEKIRLSLVAKFYKNYSKFLSFAISESYLKVKYSTQIIDVILFRKGLATEISKGYNDYEIIEKCPSTSEKVREYSATRQKIAKLIMEGINKYGSKEEYEQYFKTLEIRKEILENDILKIVHKLSDNYNLSANIRYDINKKLSTQQLLVEYIKYAKFEFVDKNGCYSDNVLNEKYIAFTLEGKIQESIEIFELDDADTIDNIIIDFREAIYKRKSENEIGIKLQEKIIKPFMNKLYKKKQIIFSTEGEISKLPFEVLPIDNGYFIDQYLFNYVSSSRDIIRNRRENDIIAGKSLVVADPDFSLQESNIEESYKSSQYHNDKLKLFKLENNNRGLCFERLIFAGIEGERIGEKLGVKPLMRDKALEGDIKKMCSPEILHLATHGFFVSNNENSKNKKDFLWLDGKENSIGKLNNPLLQSFLALAGAQTWLEDGILPKLAEDGILTAEDVLCLNLKETKLVVLSACETGIGKIQNGEGIMGLRSAFSVAGAKNLVISLWSVNDMATLILMDKFYENIKKNDGKYSLSLKEAQIYLRDLTVNELNENETFNYIRNKANEDESIYNAIKNYLNEENQEKQPFKFPYYWGVFISQGLD